MMYVPWGQSQDVDTLLFLAAGLSYDPYLKKYLLQSLTLAL